MTDLVDDSNDRQVIDNLETSRSLGQVINERLWTMMQRSLYDPLSARRLLAPVEEGTGDYELTGVGLVDINTGKEAMDNMAERTLFPEDRSTTRIESDFDDLFDDVPNCEDDGQFEALFDDRRKAEISDEFEDLFVDKQLSSLYENEEPLYAPTEGQNIDIDVVAHSGIECWQNDQESEAGDLLDDLYFGESKVSYIDNQGMLF